MSKAKLLPHVSESKRAGKPLRNQPVASLPAASGTEHCNAHINIYSDENIFKGGRGGKKILLGFQRDQNHAYAKNNSF